MSLQRSDSLTFRESYKKAAASQKAVLLLSSWFGSGLLPRAPGTFGTLGGVPLIVVLSYLGTAWEGLALIVFIPLSVWVSDISRKLLDKDDPPEVVIDEVAGLLMTFVLLPFSWVGLLLGFLFFRVFDISKPFPIGTIDKRMRGGVGIVLDDLVAGVYANICVRILLLLLG